MIGLALFASGTPSPLYGTYRELWGFSPLVLTLVYATYAFGVLAALLLAGRLSDEVGRRPVLLAALGTLMATTVLFMLADSVAWLFVARGIQGLATGLALGAASAALLDLHPRRDPAGVGLTNGVVSAGGMGLGVLVSAALVAARARAARAALRRAARRSSRSPSPARCGCPSRSPARGSPRLTPQRPSVPAAVRRPFLLASLGVISSLVGRRPVPLARPAAVGEPIPHRQPPRRRPRRLRAGRLRRRRAARVRRTAPWAGAAGGSVALATGMIAIVLAACDRLAARCSGSAR